MSDSSDAERVSTTAVSEALEMLPRLHSRSSADRVLELPDDLTETSELAPPGTRTQEDTPVLASDLRRRRTAQASTRITPNATFPRTQKGQDANLQSYAYGTPIHMGTTIQGGLNHTGLVDDAYGTKVAQNFQSIKVEGGNASFGVFQQHFTQDRSVFACLKASFIPHVDDAAIAYRKGRMTETVSNEGSLWALADQAEEPPRADRRRQDLSAFARHQQ